MLKIITEQGNTYATKLSAGFDLPAREDVEIPARGRALIPTGVYVRGLTLLGKIFACFGLIPEMQIRARSSTIKMGLFIPNGPGTVDADYPKEVMILAYNLTDEPVTVKRGVAIAQAIGNITFTFNGVQRQRATRVDGFGSTGK